MYGGMALPHERIVMVLLIAKRLPENSGRTCVLTKMIIFSIFTGIEEKDVQR